MRTMSLILICSVSFVSCQLDDGYSASTYSNLIDESFSSSSCSEFASLVYDVIKDWDTSLVGSSQGEDFEDIPVSLENARNLSTESEVAFWGYDALGRETYFNHTERIGIKYSGEGGYYKYVTPPLSDEETIPASNYSDADAIADAEMLWNGLELPEEERDAVFATGIGVADIGPDGEKSDGRAIARHVRMTREINGIRAIDSDFSCEYMLNGRLIYFRVRWPAFRLQVNEGIATADEAREAIAKRLCDSNLDSKIIKNGHSEVVYRYRENGYHEPVLEVTFDNAEGETAVFYEYSLLSGFLY